MRFKRESIVQIFNMIPKNIQNCLKKVICLRYDEEPPYDWILQCLE